MSLCGKSRTIIGKLIDLLYGLHDEIAAPAIDSDRRDELVLLIGHCTECLSKLERAFQSG